MEHKTISNVKERYKWYNKCIQAKIKSYEVIYNDEYNVYFFDRHDIESVCFNSENGACGDGGSFIQDDVEGKGIGTRLM